MNEYSLNSIGEADRGAYERDGIVCLRGMFDRDWVAFMREWVERAVAAPGPYGEEYGAKNGAGRFFGDLDIARRHEGFRRFVHESPAGEIAGRIMRSTKANFFYDQLLVKEPGTAERTPWHQDQPYWAVAGKQVCSIWLPLDPISEETCVEYVAGSHSWPEFSPYHFTDGSPYEGTGLPPLPDIEAERERHEIRRFALEPGDCLLFQAMIVHGAPGNRSAQRRRALATRWTGDDARYCIRPGEMAIPTRDPGLTHGDLMDCADFPVVWRMEKLGFRVNSAKRRDAKRVELPTGTRRRDRRPGRWPGGWNDAPHTHPVGIQRKLVSMGRESWIRPSGVTLERIWSDTKKRNLAPYSSDLDGGVRKTAKKHQGRENR